MVKTRANERVNKGEARVSLTTKVITTFEKLTAKGVKAVRSKS